MTAATDAETRTAARMPNGPSDAEIAARVREVNKIDAERLAVEERGDEWASAPTSPAERRQRRKQVYSFFLSDPFTPCAMLAAIRSEERLTELREARVSLELRIRTLMAMDA